MLKPVSRSEAIARFAGELMKEEDSSLKKQFIEVLAELDESEWETLQEYCIKTCQQGYTMNHPEISNSSRRLRKNSRKISTGRRGRQKKRSFKAPSLRLGLKNVVDFCPRFETQVIIKCFIAGGNTAHNIGIIVSYVFDKHKLSHLSVPKGWAHLFIIACNEPMFYGGLYGFTERN